jgi:hypothetical protein
MAARKKTLSTATEATFLIAAGILDTIKFCMLGLEVIVGPGTAIDLIGSEMIGVIEIVFIFGGLGLCGAYSGQNFVKNILTAFGGSVIDLIPIIDHSPSTTVSTWVIIRNSRKEDKKRYQADLAKEAVAKQHQIEQQARVEAANAAVVRSRAA